jgi:hypothetical protein
MMGRQIVYGTLLKACLHRDPFYIVYVVWMLVSCRLRRRRREVAQEQYVLSVQWTRWEKGGAKHLLWSLYVGCR